MSNEWITDRRPTAQDGTKHHELVYDYKGNIVHYEYVANGEAWKPIPNCEPYVKPKRARVVEEQRYDDDGFDYAVSFGVGTLARHIPTREAAERIAAIYEEVIP